MHYQTKHIHIMKSSQLIIKAQDQPITAVELSKGIPGELAIVSLNVMRELLNAHAHHTSLDDLKEKMVDKLDNCKDMHAYEDILSYELAMLQLHRNLKAYDDTKFEEKKKAKEPGAVMGRESFHSFSQNTIDDLVNRD